MSHPPIAENEEKMKKQEELLKTYVETLKPVMQKYFEEHDIHHYSFECRYSRSRNIPFLTIKFTNTEDAAYIRNQCHSKSDGVLFNEEKNKALKNSTEVCFSGFEQIEHLHKWFKSPSAKLDAKPVRPAT